jgi:SNF2 family DNA or RNA helicase
MGQGESLYDMVIVNYNSRILDKWMGQLIDISPASIILDECHAIKNPKAQQSKLVQELISETQARVIALSGTPVVNRPMEFYQIVKALGHAKTLGGYSEYKRRYDNNRTEAHHELNTRARTHFMVRRLKKDVLTELPPKMYSTVPIEIINREAYRKAEADIASYFATKKSQDKKFMESVIAYCDAKRYEGETREKFIDAAKAQHYNASYAIAAQNEQLLRWEALKQLAVQGKMPAVFEWIETFLESDEKLVVFVTHTAIGEAIAARFDAEFIHGGVSPDARLPIVDRFQNDPEQKVIVGNMIAMGEGLTLTAASNVCFVELGWNRKQHAQAEDRCHRIGQHDSVMVWHLIAENTIEQEIIDLIERKRVVSEAIQDGDEQTQREMLAELERILEERLSKARGAE